MEKETKEDPDKTQKPGEISHAHSHHESSSNHHRHHHHHDPKKQSLMRKTRRNRTTKLELGGIENVHKHTALVSKALYNYHDPPQQEAKDNTVWRTTDKVHGDAKLIYDNIYNEFMQPAQVYRLNSIKHKTKRDLTDEDRIRMGLPSQYDDDGLDDDSSLGEAPLVPGAAREPNTTGSIELGGATEISHEEILSQKDKLLDTFINPYALPAPWQERKRATGNGVYYYNPETGDRVDEDDIEKHPGMVWEQKYNMLQKLSPREDLDGFDYRETDMERRKRLRVQLDFEQRAQAEVERRINDPTDVEQIEDCLYYIIEKIATKAESLERTANKKAIKAMRESWNPACQGFFMRPMPTQTSEDGDEEVLVTDKEFLDVIITPTGLVLPHDIPLATIDLHDEERRVAAEKERERKAIEDYERNLPLGDKARMLVAVARNDPKEAMKRVQNGAKEAVLAPIRNIRTLTTKKILNYSGKMIRRGASGLADVARDPKKYLERAREFIRKYMPEKKNELDGLGDLLEDLQEQDREAEEEAARIFAEAEAEAERKRNRPDPFPVDHPDAIMVTITMLIEIPPRMVEKIKKNYKELALEKTENFRLNALRARRLAYIKSPGDPDLKMDVYPWDSWRDVQLRKAKYDAEQRNLRKHVWTRGEALESPDSILMEHLFPLTEEEHEAAQYRSVGMKSPKFVYYLDTNQRDMFERILTKELEKSLLCEEGAVQIEEIRSLDHSDDRLQDAYYENLQLERELQEAKALARRLKDEDEDLRELKGGKYSVMDDVLEDTVGLTQEQIKQRLAAVSAKVGEVGQKVSAVWRLRQQAKLEREAEAARMQIELELRTTMEGVLDGLVGIIEIREAKKLEKARKKAEKEKKQVVKVIQSLVDLVCINAGELPDIEDYVDDVDADVYNDDDDASFNSSDVNSEGEGDYIDTNADAADSEADVSKEDEGWMPDIIHNTTTTTDAPITQSGEESKPEKVNGNANTDTLEEQDKEMKNREAEEDTPPTFTNPYADDDAVPIVEAEAEKEEDTPPTFMNPYADDDAVPIVEAEVEEVNIDTDGDGDKEDGSDIGTDVSSDISSDNDDGGDEEDDDDDDDDEESLADEEENKKTLDNEPATAETGEEPVAVQEEEEDDDESEYIPTDSDEEPEQEPKLKPDETGDAEVIADANVNEGVDDGDQKIIDGDHIDNTDNNNANAGLDPPVDDDNISVGSQLTMDPTLLATELKEPVSLPMFKEHEESVVNTDEAHIGKNEDGPVAESQDAEEDKADDESSYQSTVYSVGTPRPPKESDYVPKRPPDFKLGLIDPSELLDDPKYWLGKLLRPLTEEEKVDRRLRKLKLAQDADFLRDQLEMARKEYKRLQEDFYRYKRKVLIPLRDKLKKGVDAVAPVIKTALGPLSRAIAKAGSALLNAATGKKGGQSSRSYLIHGDVKNAVMFLCYATASAAHGNENSKDVAWCMDSLLDQVEDRLAFEDYIPDDTSEISDASQLSKDSSIDNESKDSDGNDEDDDVDSNKDSNAYGSDNERGDEKADDDDDDDDVELDDHAKALMKKIDDMFARKKLISKKLRYVQLQLMDGEWGSNPDDDEYFTKLRKLRLKLYPSQMVDAMDYLVDTVARQVTEEEDALLLEKQRNPPIKLKGCDVSFSIRITPEMRERVKNVVGMDEFSASDLGHFVSKQIMDKESSLAKGELTRKIISSRFKTAYGRRLFDEWQSYWVHVIHPSFFGYTTKHIRKREKKPDNNLLPPGLQLVQPISKFDNAQRDLFQTINVRKAPRKTKKMREAEAREKRIVDLNVDEFKGEVGGDAGLQLYRPNMSTITARDVRKLNRVYDAFEDVYQMQMRRGLVDGRGLRPEQHQALKDRDAAFRIFRTARQKYNQDMRTEGSMADNQPMIIEAQITKITKKIFKGWIKEVKEEETQERKNRKINAERVKVMRIQEAESRKFLLKNKAWLCTRLIELSPGADFIGVALATELDRQDKLDTGETPMTNEEKAIHENTQLKVKKQLIEEEKGSRKLYQFIHSKYLKGKKNYLVKQKKRMDNEIKDKIDAQAQKDLNDEGNDSEEEKKEVEEEYTFPSPVMPDDIDEDGELAFKEATPADYVFKFLHDIRTYIHDCNKRKRGIQKKKDEERERRAIIKRNEKLEFMRKKAAEESEDPKSKAKRLKAEAAQKKEEEDDSGSDSDNSSSNSSSDGSDDASSNGNAKKQNKLTAKDDDPPPGYDSDEDSLDRYEERLEKVTPLVPEIFTQEEVDTLLLLKWVKVIEGNEIWSQCFRELPVRFHQMFTRDDLAQFANLVTTIEPIYKDVARAYEVIQRQSDMLQMQQMQKARRNKAISASKVMSAEEKAKIMTEGMAEEAKKRAERLQKAAKRRAKREAEWKYAHHHMYITIPPEPIFCVQCVTARYDEWVDNHKVIEDRWRNVDLNNSHRNHIEDYQEECWSDLRERGLDYVKSIIKAEEDRLAAEEEERRLKQERVLQVEDNAKTALQEKIDEDGNAGEGDELVSGMNDSLAAPLSLELSASVAGSQVTGTHTLGTHGTVYTEPTADAAAALGVPSRHAREQMLGAQRVPPSILAAGIPSVDAWGENILPQDQAEEAAEEEEEIDENAVDEDLLEQDAKAPPLGMMFRVWNYEAFEKKEFLGSATVSRDELLDPPKGRRAFQLREDARMTKLAKSFEVEITGNLFLKIGVAKTNKKKIPIAWRVEIIKCMGLFSCDVIGKSNPIVECFWRGPAYKDGELLVLSNWLSLGFVGPKDKTIDPAFTRDDRNLLELPPRWTDYDIMGRGPLAGLLEGGAWCAKNQLPEADPASQNVKGSALDEINKRLVQEHDVALAKSQDAQHKDKGDALELLKNTIADANEHAKEAAAEELEDNPFDHEAVKRVVEFKKEVRQVLLDSEERERRYMYAEERLRRQYVYEQKMIECKPYKIQNMAMNQQFSNLKQYINEIPPILDRLIFMMGEDLDGGGKRFKCKDPATGELLQVTSVPLLFPEDEQELQSQMQSLIGTYHMNLMKILDYSTHYLRKFNLAGYTASNERIAIIISEDVAGKVPLRHITSTGVFDRLSNVDLRDWLREIVGGISFLHSNGLVHRNLHPDCVVLEFPPDPNDIEDDDDDLVDERIKRKRESKFIYDKIRPVLTDYWFMHNPRAPGCAYSYGRADWGFAPTAPPEVKGGHRISDKSDVYAFGLLAFYWATKGQYPNMETTTMDGIKALLPLKWGPWLHSLLRMCLQKNPKMRATSAEVFDYLSSIKVAKLTVLDKDWTSGLILMDRITKERPNDEQST